MKPAADTDGLHQPMQFIIARGPPARDMAVLDAIPRRLEEGASNGGFAISRLSACPTHHHGHVRHDDVAPHQDDPPLDPEREVHLGLRQLLQHLATDENQPPRNAARRAE